MEIVVKVLIAAIAVAAACSLSSAPFAQSNGPYVGNPTQAAIPQSAAHLTAESTAVSGNAGRGHHWYSFLRAGARNARSGNDCHGPVSFCNTFFGE